MIVDLVAAALAGILIPLGLNYSSTWTRPSPRACSSPRSPTWSAWSPFSTRILVTLRAGRGASHVLLYCQRCCGSFCNPRRSVGMLIGYGAILIWTGWARWGRRFVTIGEILLLVAGLLPLGNALILLPGGPLSARRSRRAAATGFIILGGAEDRLVGEARRAPALNEASERIVEAATLARRFPEAKVAWSGGDAGILYKTGSEAEGARSLLPRSAWRKTG